jgi:hypothetical protein
MIEYNAETAKSANKKYKIKDAKYFYKSYKVIVTLFVFCIIYLVLSFSANSASFAFKTRLLYNY